MNIDPAADFAASVAEAYWGEVYGIAMYARIAAARPDPQERAKWETMTELEVVMEARLRPLFERLGGDPNEHLGHWGDKGRVDGARYGAYDWNALMQRFSRELDDDIAAYRAIEDGCPPEDAQVLRWLTEHEVVAKSFTDDELGGRSHRSIAPVRRLIAELRAGKTR